MPGWPECNNNEDSGVNFALAATRASKIEKERASWRERMRERAAAKAAECQQRPPLERRLLRLRLLPGEPCCQRKAATNFAFAKAFSEFMAREFPLLAVESGAALFMCCSLRYAGVVGATCPSLILPVSNDQPQDKLLN